MAIHENLIDKITALSDSWEGKTGKQVEDFICRRLDQPLGSTITYANETLTLYNPEGKEVASGKVTVVPPNYNTLISFPQLVISGNVNEGNVELNYTSTSTFEAGINVKTLQFKPSNCFKMYCCVLNSLNPNSGILCKFS